MVSDAQIREEALQPTGSYIVQAPAGSGKTGLLVYRFLALLGQVNKPQSVLAITFTRKARAEMRERVLALLLSAAQGESGDSEFAARGIELATRVLARDAELGWQLLAAPHQLQILTIDSFSAKLAGSMPWLSQLGDRPRTTDRADTHYAAAVEQMLEELLDRESPLAVDLQTVLLELDFNYQRARELFSEMLQRRDQWLRQFMHREVSSERAVLQHAWAELQQEIMQQVSALLPEHTIEALFEQAVAAAGRVDFSSDRAEQFMRPLLDLESPAKAELRHWRALAQLLLVKDGKKFRAAVNVNVGFPAGKSGEADKARFKACLEEFADDDVLRAALQEIRCLPDAQFSEADWQTLTALERVLTALAVRLQLRFRSAGECDHSEVTQRANLALAEHHNPTDLGLQLDAQIEHVLVDEFQDTSSAQLSLLKKLTRGWQPDEPRSLFLVGDPMQSIYRFREADVSLFLQAVDNDRTGVFPNLHLKALTLEQNFRSSEALVGWFNSTFAQCFPANSSVLKAAISYVPASAARQTGHAAAPVQSLIAHNKQQEGELLLSSVQQALAELPDADSRVAILVRTRPQLGHLLPLLERAGIAYSAVDIEPLAQQQAVLDVVALCKAICREHDRVAWLALLRGPWCGLSLSEIKELAKTETDVTIWQQLQSPQRAELTPASAQRLDRFVQIMRATLLQCQQVDLGSLTRWAWQRLGGELTAAAQLRDLDAVFELIDRLQSGGDLASMQELEQALEGLYAQSAQSADARVVVSTIHKAKGLQYHTVILPGLSSAARSDAKSVLMWAEHQTRDGDTNLLLAPLQFKAREASHYEYLRTLERERSNNELLRLTYVACTRAEDRLVLLGTALQDGDTGAPRKPRSGSLLGALWPALEEDTGFSLSAPVEAIEQTDRLVQELQRLPGDYRVDPGKDIEWDYRAQLTTAQSPSNEEFEFEWATEVAQGVGTLLHDWLQYTDREALQQPVSQSLRARWRAELLALRVPASRVSDALAQLQTGVENIASDPQAQFIFADHPIAHNEYTLASVESGGVRNYRLDRTFVDHDGVRWIVDYKSTSTRRADIAEFVDQQVAERHRGQLQNYASLMRQIDTRPIRLAVYFPLLKELRVWDYQPD